MDATPDTTVDTTTDAAPDAVEHDYPVIRPERTDGEDIGAIHALTAEAFAGAEHSSGTESAIIDALRDADALTISLVAVHAGRIVGHAAASPVVLTPQREAQSEVEVDELAESFGDWYGLGPLSVHPDFQRQGVGSALMRAMLDNLIELGAAGAVLLGEPSLYSRFEFFARDGLTMEGLPEEEAPYFQARRLDSGDGAGAAPDNAAAYPKATVRYHPAFDAT
ncbi:MAG: GNAT family N-acetyltransferase [Mycobacteriaceae bacterium]|uniref:GNAT family N-acetyltransferase n=1 Tax=Corynebacterium sp. TaxID=1720 RepID=UPI003F94C32E